MARVLIVDDDPVFRRLHAYLLRADGHETAEADGVASASRRCHALRIDIVVCDQMMSDGTGLDLLDLLEDLRPRPAFVLISGAADLDEPRLGRVDAYLTKPVASDVLRSATAAALSARASLLS